MSERWIWLANIKPGPVRYSKDAYAYYLEAEGYESGEQIFILSLETKPLEQLAAVVNGKER